MKVRYIAQPNDYGCAIACCAMVAGKSYAEVEHELSELGHKGGAISETSWDQYLIGQGFAATKKYRWDSVAGKHRDEWPPQPWAPVHIAQVIATAGAHAVVVLADGLVCDPFDPSRETLRDPAYKEVHFVIGYHRRADSLPPDIIAALRAGREDDEMLPGEAGALRRVMEWAGVEGFKK